MSGSQDGRHEHGDHSEHDHSHGDAHDHTHAGGHQAHGHSHGHGHDHGEDGHGHTHGVIDPTIATTERGIWAIKWSFAGLMATAIFQVFVVAMSGSVGLLADTIHNFGDASTAIPLWIAFLFARRKPSKRFTYGYGRVEDIAGVLIVLTILFSAIVAGHESIDRLLNPKPVTHLTALVIASLVGFVGNEAVAVFRIRVGKEIDSAALIADGYHARVDGWTSLAVLGGAVGVWLGYPLADPIIGLLITIAILGIVWQSARAVFTRMLDGVEPEHVEAIRHSTLHVDGVQEVSEVRARWLGHRLTAEVNIAVDPSSTVVQGHDIARAVHQRILHDLPFTSRAVIHVDPQAESGEIHHAAADRQPDAVSSHSH